MPAHPAPQPALPTPALVGTRITAPIGATLTALVLAVTLVATLAPTPTADAAAMGHHRTRWDCLAHFESTHRWHVNTGNGHYGGLQFSLPTWRAYGGARTTGRRFPHRASRRAQIRIAKRVAWRGWGPHRPQGGRHAWPSTWRRCF